MAVIHLVAAGALATECCGIEISKLPIADGITREREEATCHRWRYQSLAEWLHLVWMILMLTSIFSEKAKLVAWTLAPWMLGLVLFLLINKDRLAPDTSDGSPEAGPTSKSNP